MAELFHGPTAAFKDLALSCVGQVMNYVLQRRNKHAVAIVGAFCLKVVVVLFCMHV